MRRRRRFSVTSVSLIYSNHVNRNSKWLVEEHIGTIRNLEWKRRRPSATKTCPSRAISGYLVVQKVFGNRNGLFALLRRVVDFRESRELRQPQSQSPCGRERWPIFNGAHIFTKLPGSSCRMQFKRQIERVKEMKGWMNWKDVISSCSNIYWIILISNW